MSPFAVRHHSARADSGGRSPWDDAPDRPTVAAQTARRALASNPSGETVTISRTALEELLRASGGAAAQSEPARRASLPGDGSQPAAPAPSPVPPPPLPSAMFLRGRSSGTLGAAGDDLEEAPGSLGGAADSPANPAKSRRESHASVGSNASVASMMLRRPGTTAAKEFAIAMEAEAQLGTADSALGFVLEQAQADPWIIKRLQAMGSLGGKNKFLAAASAVMMAMKSKKSRRRSSAPADTVSRVAQGWRQALSSDEGTPSESALDGAEGGADQSDDDAEGAAPPLGTSATAASGLGSAGGSLCSSRSSVRQPAPSGADASPVACRQARRNRVSVALRIAALDSAPPSPVVGTPDDADAFDAASASPAPVVELRSGRSGRDVSTPVAVGDAAPPAVTGRTGRDWARVPAAGLLSRPQSVITPPVVTVETSWEGATPVAGPSASRSAPASAPPRDAADTSSGDTTASLAGQVALSAAQGPNPSRRVDTLAHRATRGDAWCAGAGVALAAAAAEEAPLEPPALPCVERLRAEALAFSQVGDWLKFNILGANTTLVAALTGSDDPHRAETEAAAWPAADTEPATTDAASAEAGARSGPHRADPPGAPRRRPDPKRPGPGQDNAPPSPSAAPPGRAAPGAGLGLRRQPHYAPAMAGPDGLPLSVAEARASARMAAAELRNAWEDGQRAAAAAAAAAAEADTLASPPPPPPAQSEAGPAHSPDGVWAEGAAAFRPQGPSSVPSGGSAGGGTSPRKSEGAEPPSPFAEPGAPSPPTARELMLGAQWCSVSPAALAGGITVEAGISGWGRELLEALAFRALLEAAAPPADVATWERKACAANCPSPPTRAADLTAEALRRVPLPPAVARAAEEVPLAPPPASSAAALAPQGHARVSSAGVAVPVPLGHRRNSSRGNLASSAITPSGAVSVASSHRSVGAWPWEWEIDVHPGAARRIAALIASLYRGNLYHSALHAADVLHAARHALVSGGLGARLAAPSRVAFVLAAAAHDAGHPGVNNIYLTATAHPLALRYGDASPLERMHAASLLELVHACPEADVMSSWSATSRRAALKLAFQCIVHTDNAGHFAMVDRLKARGALITAADDSASAADAPGHSPDPRGGPLDLSPGSEDEQLVAMASLHAADISNPYRHWELNCRWGDFVTHEFWLQGRREHAAGVPVGPANDATAAAPKPFVQAGFAKAFCLPLLCGVAGLGVVDVQPWVDQLQRNVATYECLARHVRAVIALRQPSAAAAASSGLAASTASGADEDVFVVSDSLEAIDEGLAAEEADAESTRSPKSPPLPPRVPLAPERRPAAP